jgi:hypothetical protein
MVGEYGNVIFTLRLYLQHEGLYGGISTEGESSSMVEDAPAAIEHGHQRLVMGTVQRNSLSVISMSSTPCDRTTIRCPSMRPILWSFFGMLHT